MLTIKRKVGESAMIGDNVKITVMSVDGAKVRIGIDAPNEIAVHREEIYDKLKQQKLEAKHLADTLNK